MQKQIQLLLTNRQYAIVCAVILALFPYTAWLSIVTLALITLRKGWREGAFLLIPVMAVHMGCSLLSLSGVAAAVNTIALFLPCYIAAYVLRLTTSWQAVVGVFFLLISLGSLLIQIFVPNFIMAQYMYLQAMLKDVQTENILTQLMSDASGVNQVVLASYAFGLQMMSIAFSAMTSLMIARSMQSRLFNPGGFKQEMLQFRANGLSLLILAIITVGAFLQHNMMAMMLFPSLVLYFLLAGLSLSANTLIKKNPRAVLILLVLPLVFLPFVMVPVYTTLGLLDSLFNLKGYAFKSRKRG